MSPPTKEMLAEWTAEWQAAKTKLDEHESAVTIAKIRADVAREVFEENGTVGRELLLQTAKGELASAELHRDRWVKIEQEARTRKDKARIEIETAERSAEAERAAREREQREKELRLELPKHIDGLFRCARGMKGMGLDLESLLGAAFRSGCGGAEGQDIGEALARVVRNGSAYPDHR